MTIKYAQIANEETKQVNVGLGDDVAFYKSIGMTEMEVEQAYNGSWYVAGYAPEEPEEEKKAKRKAELILQLDVLDLKCIRSLRAIQSGSGTEEDTTKLAEYEDQAEEIRAQLKDL